LSIQKSNIATVFHHYDEKRLVHALGIPFLALPMHQCHGNEASTHDQGGNNTRAISNANALEHRGKPENIISFSQ
jgi:hypothetical protein